MLFLEEEIDRVERHGARRRPAARAFDRQVGGEQPVRQPGGSGSDFIALVADRTVHGVRVKSSDSQRTKTCRPREPIFRPMQIMRRAESLSGRYARTMCSRGGTGTPGTSPRVGGRAAHLCRIVSTGGRGGMRRLLVGDLQHGRERIDRCRMRGRTMRREREREFGGLRADRLELRDNLRIRAAIGAFEARFQRVDGCAERRRPPA